MAHKDKATRQAYSREYYKRYRRENPEYYQRERERAEAKRRRRLAFLHSVKLEYGCKDCGYREDARALQFDHLPEFEKIQRLSVMTKGNFEKLIDEMVKCEVVCANCHAIRTHERAVV